VCDQQNENTRTTLTIERKIASIAAPRSKQRAATIFYVVHRVVHCHDNMRKHQRYLTDVGKITMTAQPSF